MERRAPIQTSIKGSWISCRKEFRVSYRVQREEIVYQKLLKYRIGCSQKARGRTCYLNSSHIGVLAR